MTDLRRRLPSVDAVLAWDEVAVLMGQHPRAAVVDAVRGALGERRAAGAGDEDLGTDVAMRLRPSMQRVINATGVVLNTNLGRAPLADAAIRATAAASGYASVEWDVREGRRASRDGHVADHLAAACGAPAAAVVNTNAGAVLLALCALAGADAAGPREVVVSRGQLVEIGGGFRVPDVLEASGCRMVEVGTTNRTRLDDYEAAIGPRTAAILRVHRSNFRMEGFVAEPGLEELARLARRAGLVLIDDIGGGLLAPDPLLPDEPDARAGVAAGAVVCFSADKLMGGPQAGVVVGPDQAVGSVARHPLARALRVDKLRLAALEATLRLHRDPAEARRTVPALRVLHEEPAARRARADRLVGLAGGEPVATAGVVGGGTAPGVELPSWGVALHDDNPEERARRLRAGEVPVAALIREGRLLLDVLAVDEAELDELARLVAASA